MQELNRHGSAQHWRDGARQRLVGRPATIGISPGPEFYCGPRRLPKTADAAIQSKPPWDQIFVTRRSDEHSASAASALTTEPRHNGTTAEAV